MVVAQAIVNWHFAAQSFFYADDWVAFENAQSGSYTPHWLLAIHGGHLSPGRRALTLFIQYHATLDYHFALGLLLVAHSASVVLVQRILRLLFGAAWWTYAVAFAYGISIVAQPSLQWFTAGVLILPAATFSLAAIHAYLCWWNTGRRAWLVWSAIALAFGLGFYIKTLLVPLYLILIRGFLLEPDRPLRESLRDTVREWRVWLIYAVPIGAALVVYLVRGYGEHGSGFTAHTVADFFWTAWRAGFVPALFGIRVPIFGDPTFHSVATAGCQIALVAVAAFTIVRRRSAWRVWALVVFVFLVNTAVVVPRLGLGATIGYALRYFAETTYFAAIVLPFAFALPRRRGAPAPAALTWPRPAVVLPAVALIATYAAFAWASDAAFTRHWPGREAKSWAANVRGDLDRVRRREPQPVLLDGAVPADVLPFWVQPGRLPATNSLVAVLGVFEPGLRFNEVSPRTYRVRGDGHVEAVSFAAARNGPRLAPGCLGSPGRPRTFEWKPEAPFPAHDPYLRIAYRTDPGSPVTLQFDRGAGYPSRADGLLAAQPSGGTSLLALGAPPTARPVIAGMRVAVPAGRRVCFTQLDVGAFRPRS